MTSPDVQFWTGALNAFQNSIDRYCVWMTASGAQTDGLQVSINVTTLVPATPDIRARIHRIANQYIDAQLPGARVVSIDISTNKVAEPGYHFIFLPTVVGGVTVLRTMPDEQTGPTVTWDVESLRLTLRYGPFQYVFRIAAGSNWVPFGRWPRADGHDASVRLPDHASYIPRGELLRVRNQGGHLEFERTRFKPHYTIRIDGVPLLAGDMSVDRGAGVIEYLCEDQSPTVLNYHVIREM